MIVTKIEKEEAWLYAANYLDQRKTYNICMKQAISGMPT
jgi:hypothetical protein